MKGNRVYSSNTSDSPAGSFDNLYIDMNGVIHPAFHPQTGKSPTSYEEVFERLFLYLDRLMNVIQPRKVLYLSIDGPAPRAKMNQQRYRRFRTVQESSISECIGDHLKNVILDTLTYKMRLMTNNPTKRAGLIGYGLEVVENVPIEIESNKHNELYLQTKRDRMGHDILRAVK